MEQKQLWKRLIMARFNPKCTKLTFTTFYAPREDAEEAKKDVSYDHPQQVIPEVSSHMLCVIG